MLIVIIVHTYNASNKVTIIMQGNVYTPTH